jgi:hypothetical protein
MRVGRVAYWVFAVAAMCCFGYAAHILLAWPEPPRDPRLAGIMAEVTANRVAAFTLTLGSLICGWVVGLLRTTSDEWKGAGRS